MYTMWQQYFKKELCSFSPYPPYLYYHHLVMTFRTPFWYVACLSRAQRPVVCAIFIGRFYTEIEPTAQSSPTSRSNWWHHWNDDM